VKEALEEDGVDEQVLHSTLEEIVPLVQKSVMHVYDDIDDPSEFPGPEPGELANYAAQRHKGRLKQITNVEQKVSELEELIALD